MLEEDTEDLSVSEEEVMILMVEVLLEHMY